MSTETEVDFDQISEQGGSLHQNNNKNIYSNQKIRIKEGSLDFQQDYSLIVEFSAKEN